MVGTAGGAAVGAGVERLLEDTELTWVQGTAGPDADATLQVRRPARAKTVRATLELVVKTPLGVQRASLQEVDIVGGDSALDVTLPYPFDDFVHGTYAYHVRLNIDGQSFQTTQPIHYKVEPFLWFS